MPLATISHWDKPDTLSRRWFLLAITSIVASGCTTIVNIPETIDEIREKIRSDLLKCIVILNSGEPKKMHPKMDIEWPNKNGNFIFSFPDLKHITEDIVEVNPLGVLVTKEIKINIENMIFAIFARQRHGIESGDTYTIRRIGYTISIDKV